MPYVGHNSFMGMPMLLAFCSWLNNYSCVAAPLLVTAKEICNPVSSIAVTHFRKLLITLQELAQAMWGPFLNVIRMLYAPIDRTERAFFRMQNLFTLINQITFFLLADALLNTYTTSKKAGHVTSLYSLMFYNVISYCTCYIKELIEKEDWSPYVHITKASNVKHLAMTTTKIVLEFTKAVTFIITVIFMLLVFGLEQKLENYQPSTCYTIITWLFYMSTEKVFTDIFKSAIQFLQLDYLESLELLYTPVFLQSFTMVLTGIFILPVMVLYGKYRIILMALYFNIYLRYKHLNLFALNDLRQEQKALVPFRHATSEELNGFDDICAVCLSPMKLARITPCHHLFHADCLRQCLKTSNNCPICKQEYIILR
ncbi:E3 ubiquitin-protein ligase RNF139-like isoform X2 [Chrysoperla carnea]|nr:E3 ubiquitin-protein ligase RNF139-like isoform X2 [Chrysoperla carnea]